MRVRGRVGLFVLCGPNQTKPNQTRCQRGKARQEARQGEIEYYLLMEIESGNYYERRANASCRPRTHLPLGDRGPYTLYLSFIELFDDPLH
jgi:hypothetical protein